jgi:hypothetical protein
VHWLEITMTTFEYVVVLVSIVVGLGLAHLLHGVGRLISQPLRWKIYWVHLVWAFSTFLFLVHFWWWEFQMSTVEVWTPRLYMFLILYAVLLFLVCVILFPDDFPDGSDYREYFYGRRRWFFGLWLAILSVDTIDTMLKGGEYVADLPISYWKYQACGVVIVTIAMVTRNARFHAAFAVLYMFIQLGWLFGLRQPIS